MTTFICLGKIGDIIGALPILYHYFQTKKKKPQVIVSRQYAHILDQVSYVESVLYNGDWSDLEGALLYAKKRSRDVVCLSMYGKDFPIEHRCFSFQLDAYERAGVLPLWDKLKLSVPSAGAVQFKNPTILYADHAESAPFLQKEELFKLLVENFPSHDIVRLSMHRQSHFFDFVAWYNGADAIVTVDTAHLHLTAAAGKPVVALSADKPSKWKGSCWSKRFTFFCRYDEFMWRKDELVESLQNRLAGNPGMEIIEL